MPVQNFRMVNLADRYEHTIVRKIKNVKSDYNTHFTMFQLQCKCDSEVC